MNPLLFSADLVQVVDKLAKTPLSIILYVALGLTLVRLAVHTLVLKPLPVHKRPASYQFGSWISEFADAMVYAMIAVFMVIRPFALQTFIIPSGSMYTTLMINDMIVANKAIYRYTEPKRGDVVVFKPPIEALSPGHEDDAFIKRLIGVPGDVIEIRNHNLYLNGTIQVEPYKHYSKILEPTGKLMEEIKLEEIGGNQPEPNFKLVQKKDQYIPVVYGGPFQANMTRGLTADAYIAATPADSDALRDSPPAKIPEGYFLMMGDNRNGSFDSRGWGLVPRKNVIGRAEFIWLPFPRIGRISSQAPRM